MTIATTSTPTNTSNDRPWLPAGARSGADRHFATARTAGVLYVIIIACGLFAEIGVRSRLIEAGDPAATARNIIDSPLLFRFGIAADIVMFIADVAIAIVLYQLLRPLGRTLSLLAAAFRITQTAIIGLNLLNMFQAARASSTMPTT